MASDWLILLHQGIRSLGVGSCEIGRVLLLVLLKACPSFLLVHASVKSGLSSFSHPAWETDLLLMFLICICENSSPLPRDQIAEQLRLRAFFSDLHWSFIPSDRSSTYVFLFLLFLFRCCCCFGSSIFLVWFINCKMLINIDTPPMVSLSLKFYKYKESKCLTLIKHLINDGFYCRVDN